MLTIAPRARAGIALGVMVLMGLHAALLAREHVVTVLGLRVQLGAYVGALAAFMASVAASVAWHRAGGMPGARPWHVVISAWWLAGMGAIGGILLAFISERTSAGLERAWGTALLPGLLGSVLGVRGTSDLLSRWALRDASSGASAVDARAAARFIALAASVASGLFGALHPFVRFPLAVPSTGDGALVYGAVALAITAVLLPFAGRRVVSAWMASGSVARGQLRVPPAAVAYALAMTTGSAWLLAATPSSVLGWVVFRGVVSAVLGACGAWWGAARAASAR